MKLKFSLSHQKLKDDKGQPTCEIQLFKFGEFEHWSGETFTVDGDFVDQMISNFESMKASAKSEKVIPMDYNHGSLSYGHTEALAAGWITKLTKKDDGLYATVEWSERAAEYIKNEEYKYISPEFSIDVTDEYGNDIEGAVLYAAALTNRPFLKGMAPVSLSAKQNKKEKTEMTFKETIGKTLGLSGEFGETEVLAALSKVSAPLLEVRQTLGLKEGDDLVGNIKGLLSEREASKVEIIKLNEKVALLSDQQETLKATSEVEALMKAGKISPANKEHFIEIAKTNKKLFESMTKDLPVNPALTAPVGSGESNPAPIDDPMKAFEAAVTAKMKADPALNYLAASRAVQSENPELAKKYALSARTV